MKNVRQGINDFYSGQISNPYPDTTQAHREWQFGFNQAYFKNKDRQVEYERKRSETKKD